MSDTYFDYLHGHCFECQTEPRILNNVPQILYTELMEDAKGTISVVRHGDATWIEVAIHEEGRNWGLWTFRHSTDECEWPDHWPYESAIVVSWHTPFESCAHGQWEQFSHPIEMRTVPVFRLQECPDLDFTVRAVIGARTADRVSQLLKLPAE